MRAQEGKSWLNISATPATWRFEYGGEFVCEFSATWGGGSVQLNILGPDNVTYLPVTPAAWTANGTALVAIPTGAILQLVVTTATAVYFRMTRLPGE
jgi:hypothetical protein